MKEYAITKIDYQKYDLFLLCLTHESIFKFYDDLIQEPEFLGSQGILLLDQLLTTGNEENRYVAIPYNCNGLDFDKAKKVAADKKIRQISTDILYDNIAYLDSSILTDDQREQIYQRIAI